MAFPGKFFKNKKEFWMKGMERNFGKGNGWEVEERCGTCKYCGYADINDSHICTNYDSSYYTDYVEPGHGCIDWEGTDG